jgi:hypothetical protein
LHATSTTRQRQRSFALRASFNFLAGFTDMFFAAATILFVAAEFVIGWWALPVVGVILGIVGARRSAVVAQIAAAAVLSWTLLFAWSATQGSLPTFLDALAVSMKLKPGYLLTAITALPALLAGPAARLGMAVRPLRASPSTPTVS